MYCYFQCLTWSPCWTGFDRPHLEENFLEDSTDRNVLEKHATAVDILLVEGGVRNNYNSGVSYRVVTGHCHDIRTHLVDKDLKIWSLTREFPT